MIRHQGRKQKKNFFSGVKKLFPVMRRVSLPNEMRWTRKKVSTLNVMFRIGERNIR